MRWNVIWQVNPDDLSTCIERDWFAELTSLVPIESTMVDYDARPLLSHITPAAIVCASCPNQTTPDDLIDYLRRLPKPRALYHMSDEKVEIGNDVYDHCELVIRNGSANFGISDRKFVQVPLGYVNGLGNPSNSFPKASIRKYSFAFLGAMKHDRETEMIRSLRDLPHPHFMRQTNSYEESTTFFNDSTIAIYRDSIFVPNPKGNWNPECNRLYDAIEWGCIPIIRRYSDSEYVTNYHDQLLGNHPIPTFDDWRGVADFATTHLSNREALDDLQNDIVQWWQCYKSGLRSTVARKLAELIG